MMHKNSYLPEDHFSLVTSSLVTGICNPLFQDTKIRYYHYIIYRSDSVIALTSHRGWHQCYWDHAKQLITSQKNYIAEENLLSISHPVLTHKENKAAVLAKKYFQLSDFVQFLIKTENGYEELAFAGHGNQSILNFCFHNQDLLYKFCLYFKETARDLIENAYRHPIDISNLKSTQTIEELAFSKSNNSCIMFDIKKYPLNCKNKTVSLSSAEFKCLRLMALGHFSKTAAADLNLSPRTIEFHLNNIKNKLNIYSKTKLINVFYQSNLRLLI